MLLKMALYLNLSAALSQQATAFVSNPICSRSTRKFTSMLTRHMSSSPSSAVKSGISRIDTLQTLLGKAGAPGSKGCLKSNDLEPVFPDLANDDDETSRLHPHLYPISKSKSNPDHYICGLRRAYADDALYESSSNAPWPIVEATLDGPGYKLLSLNSEQLMRRIAAGADTEDGDELTDSEEELINLYNEGLGEGSGLVDAAFDNVYEKGSVAELGYGASKYMLLRVGPFPDLYEEMSFMHSKRGDESSSLIAAEASNTKFTGFASTFKFYAEILSTYSNREDETRDAARVCLRMPLPSIGSHPEDFLRVAQLAQLASQNDDHATAMQKMKGMYEKIKAHEEEDESNKANMTPEQVAIEEANAVLDEMVFLDQGVRDWRSVRTQLAEIYSKAGINDMAEFVDPKSFSS